MLVDGCERLGCTRILCRLARPVHQPVRPASGAEGSAPDQLSAPGFHCGSPATAPISETRTAGCASREQSLSWCGGVDCKGVFHTKTFVGVSVSEHVFPGNTDSGLETATRLSTVRRRNHHYLPRRDGGFQTIVPECVHLVQYVPNAAITPDIAEQSTWPVAHPWFNDPTRPVILSVARLAPQKDLATLLRAFAEVVRSRPARLVVLGEGDERCRLTLLARELGISPFVQFPGDIRPAFPYMAKAHVFVLSSAWEGLSMALLEAMACGTPVVSTDCPYGPREILEGGKWGPLVTPGDWRSLASAILETLDNPVASNLLIARANRWDAESGIARYVQVLDDVLTHPAKLAPDE